MDQALGAAELTLLPTADEVGRPIGHHGDRIIRKLIMAVRQLIRGAAGKAMLALVLIAPAPAGVAHAPAPTHGCHAPARPENDQDDVLWQRFLDAVDAFRGCISDYAEANRRAADAHNNAANAATMDWNRFVRAELNVPEDYPWPPEERATGR